MRRHLIQVLPARKGVASRKAGLALLVCLLAMALTPALTLADGPPQPKPFPEVIALPNGFAPEGIAVGRGARFFTGSLVDGRIYAGDLRTGQGAVLVPPQAGRVAVGLSFDARSGYLFVAGGPNGAGYVYDTATGAGVAAYQFVASPTPNSTFVNDVVVTRQGAYFTESFRPVLYFVPLSRRGALPDASAVKEISLGGDFEFVPDPGAFNTNGIDATPNGKTLVIVNSALGTLYRVDPASGVASLIDLGGGSVPNGDGLLLDGKTLYVVQNFLNQIAVVKLKRDMSAGTVVDTLTDPDFRIPTTIAEFGDALYAVNARFDVPVTPDTEYQVVRVSKR